MTLLEGSVGVEDLVLLEPLEQESLLKNLQLRYENREIYVSAHGCPWLWMCGQRVHVLSLPRSPARPPTSTPLIPFTFFPGSRPTLGTCWSQ